MEIVVFRHGIALDRNEAAAAGYTEPRRPLTDKGCKRTRAAATGLCTLLAERPVERILASPFRRAWQTAEILADCLDGAPMRECGALAPGAGAPALAEWLSQDTAGGDVAIVGHEPDLSDWVAWACGGARRPVVALKKAGACRVAMPEPPQAGAGTLHWLLTPRQLRALG